MSGLLFTKCMVSFFIKDIKVGDETMMDVGSTASQSSQIFHSGSFLSQAKIRFSMRLKDSNI